MPESIGKRIARLRQEYGWTQQELAARLAISRVAVSHFEMDLSIPSERSITLMAGIFKQTPQQLVEGTTYPPAKAERLPLTVCSYTGFELDMAQLETDLVWLERLSDLLSAAQVAALAAELREKWQARLEHWQSECIDTREKERLRGLWKQLYKAGW